MAEATTTRPAPSTKSVVEKLLLKSGARAAVLSAPAGYMRQFPSNMQFDSELGSGEYDFIQSFVTRKDELVELAPRIRAAAKPGALIWISYSKPRSMHTDLNRDIVRTTLQPLGLDTVSQIAIDDTWSALRVKPV